MKKLIALCFILYSFTGLCQQKKEQSIIFNPIGDKTCYDSVFVINASSTSSLPVSFEIVSGPGTISGNVFKIAKLDFTNGKTEITVLIKATQSGNEEYLAATEVYESFSFYNSFQTLSNESFITADTVICEKDTIRLSAASIPGFSNDWSTPTGKYSTATITIPDARINDNGAYKINISEGKCLLIVKTFNISVNSITSINFVDLPDSINVSLMPYTVKVSPEGGTFYVDSKLNGETILNIKDSGRYLLEYKFTNDAGCKSSFRKEITVFNPLINDHPLTIFDVVTPNGDSKNDHFEIENIHRYLHSLIISDMWGNHIFNSTNYTNSWPPENIAAGQYYYRLELKSPDKLITGSIAVIK